MLKSRGTLFAISQTQWTKRKTSPAVRTSAHIHVKVPKSECKLCDSITRAIQVFNSIYCRWLFCRLAFSNSQRFHSVSNWKTRTETEKKGNNISKCRKFNRSFSFYLAHTLVPSRQWDFPFLWQTFVICSENVSNIIWDLMCITCALNRCASNKKTISQFQYGFEQLMEISWLIWCNPKCFPLKSYLLKMCVWVEKSHTVSLINSRLKSTQKLCMPNQKRPWVALLAYYFSLFHHSRRACAFPASFSLNATSMLCATNAAFYTLLLCCVVIFIKFFSLLVLSFI